MVEKNFNFLLSVMACLAAIEAGALAACIGLGLHAEGQSGALNGLFLWLLGQMVILPLWLVVMMPAALLRMVLGLIFQRQLPVALVTGAVIGLGGVDRLTTAGELGWAEALPMFAIGLVAGLVGGWAWWRVETRFLDRQQPSEGM